MAPHRSMQGEYVQPLPPYDYLNDTPHSRPPPPPPLSRRTSDQDLVIPSVERETVDLTSSQRVTDGQRQFPVSSSHESGQVHVQPAKRKSFPSGPHSRAEYTEQSAKRSKPVNHENEAPRHHDYSDAGAPSQKRVYQAMDVHNRTRGPPFQEVIDLTSSPQRPVMNDDRGPYASFRNYAAAEPSNHSYVTMPSHHLPWHDGRGVHYDATAREAPRAYMYENDRPYERRLPRQEYMPMPMPMPMREEQRRVHMQDEGVRYPRHEFRY